ncbi:MAG: hypothetical protein RI907_3102 [Pseudomonadota bacterium]|jgi:hypothetical protein
MTDTRPDPAPAADGPSPGDAPYIDATRSWLVRAVIGLNLCPFAKGVHVKNQVRYVVSPARSPAELQADLARELDWLAQADPEVVDTTLLIHPHVLQDFLDFNDFLEVVDDTVADGGHEGVLQVASFHPEYQFGDASADDIENYTNRSPFPTLHLIREASIDRAVEAFPDAEMIYEVNMATMRRLGLDGWQRLWRSDAGGDEPTAGQGTSN